MASVFSSNETPPHDKPKTPLIAGIICGVCIGIAWSISFCNWLLKRYRRHQLKKKRRLREASGTSTVYQRSNRRRTGAYDMPTVDADKRNRATATQVSDVDRESTTASDRINRLVREVSKDSENPRVGRNNLTGADGIPGEDGGGSLQPHPQSSASHNRHVPSWIPESVWNRRHPDKPQEDSKSSPTSPSRGDGEHWTKSEEAHSLSPISPVLAKPDPRVRRVIDELEDIDVEGQAKTGRDVARTLFGT